jgi:hypothetical protein
MKLLSKLALAWMFAWLPISGVMAATMPFCAQGMGGLVVMAERSEAMPCHTQADSTSDQGQLPVEHCDLCHIAGALVPPSVPFIANAAPGVAPVDEAVSRFHSFIPDPPQHPPLSSPV